LRFGVFMQKSVPSGREFESRAGQKIIVQIKYTRNVKSMIRVVESKQKDIRRWSMMTLILRTINVKSATWIFECSFRTQNLGKSYKSKKISIIIPNFSSKTANFLQKTLKFIRKNVRNRPIYPFLQKFLTSNVVIINVITKNIIGGFNLTTKLECLLNRRGIKVQCSETLD
jgi:hypothetical protein